MPRFRFRLQTLRRLREIHRDELRGRLAEAFAAEQVILAQRQDVEREIVDLAAHVRGLAGLGAMDVAQVMSSQRYHLVLQAQARVLAEQAAQLAQEVDNRRAALVEADRQVRVLDKLEERQRQQHEQQAQAVQAKQFDEIAVMRWHRSDS